MNDIKHASLQVVSTKISKLNIENGFVSLPDDCKRSLNLDYKLGEIQTVEPDFLEEIDKECSSALITTGTMTLKIENSYQEDSMKIDVEAMAYFLYLGDDKQAFEQLARKNGAATLYSILRGQLISITAQCADGKSIILPLLNFSEISSLANKKDEI